MKFGVIGTNWITEKLIDAGKSIPDFELVAVYSRTEEKAIEFSQKHKLTQKHKQILSMLFKSICFFDLDNFLMLYEIKELRFIYNHDCLKSYFKKVSHCLDEYQKTEILINTGLKI